MSQLKPSKKIFELSLLILAAGSIYPLVYLRQNFETTILKLFEINQETLAGLYSMLGTIFVIGYIPSGWLADRFTAKKLIIFSLFLTAATGVVYAQVPDEKFLLPIFLVWGFATVFTFWSALLKAVHMLADHNEEGRFFGALDGGRGLVEAILASIVVFVFAQLAPGKDPAYAEMKAGFQAVVYIYCAVIVAIAIALIFLMPNQDTRRTAASEAAGSGTSTLKGIWHILKIREVRVMMVIIFCGYTLFWAHYYFSGYLNVNHGVTQVTAGVITVIVLWMRPVGGFSGGFLADRFGRSRVLSIAMIITAVLLLAMAFFPGTAPLGALYAITVAAGLVMYVIRGVYWAVLDECRVPPAMVGIAIGIISFFGYLPDVIIPGVSERIYKGFGEDRVAEANSVFFVVWAVIGIVGSVAALYFTRLVRQRDAQEKLSAAQQETVSALN